MDEAKRSNSRRILQSYAVLLSIASVVVLLDEWTQLWVRDNLAFGESWVPLTWLAPYARLVHWGNEGAAFGLFNGEGIGDFFAVLAIVVTALILYYFPRLDTGGWMLRFAFGLQLGGALGNLIDRLTIGYVTDFISVGRFAVFNIADAGITVGAGLLLLFTWLHRDDEEEAVVEEGERSADASVL
jgi:signal peptidase II